MFYAKNIRKLSNYQYLLLVLLVLAEIYISAHLCQTIRLREELVHENLFVSQSKEVVAAVQQQINLNLEKLLSLAAFYEVTYPVTRQKFSAFTKHLVAPGSSIKALQWVPKVPYDSLKLFLSQSAADGFQSFKITEKEKDTLAPVGKRNVYFPVYFIEPLIGNEAALGFDLASNPTRLKAMRKAAVTGNMVVTEPVKLVQEKESSKGVLIFYPLKKNGGLTGFITGVFRINDLITRSPGSFIRKDFILNVLDTSAADGNQLLARFNADDTESKKGNGEIRTGKSVRYRQLVQVADRSWLIEITPDQRYINLKSNAYWLILILCIVIGLGLCYQAFQYFLSENLLLNILPAKIAKELKSKGVAKAREFTRVSILFTDFMDFTRTSRTMNAQDLVNEINACYEAFDHIAEKYGIEKIKTIGDAYMAAGGIPVQVDESVKNTVLAALEMQRFIHDRKVRQQSSGKPYFEMRAGIHTGPVVAGIVGLRKFQYDVWGTTVNTANRMECAGEIGKVNLSQTTYEELKDDPDFIFESRGHIKTKGEGEFAMWFVRDNQDGKKYE